MVDLLGLAHDENCEADLAALIVRTLAEGALPDAKILRQQLAGSHMEMPQDRPVRLTDLCRFDALLEAGA